VLGAVLCVGGTMVVSLLKGPLLHLWPRTLADAEAPAAAASPGGGSSHSHHGMVTGTLFLCGSCLSYALWLIVQVRRLLALHAVQFHSMHVQSRLISF